MKNETVKRWFKENKPEIYMLILFILISAMLVFFFACSLLPNEHASYPEEEYKTLEKEMVETLDIIIEDNYIDIERLSEKNMEYSVNYHLEDSESGPNWEIAFKKGNLSIYATIIKSSEDALLVEKIERNLTEDFYNEQIKIQEKIRIVLIGMFGMLTLVCVSGTIVFSFKLIKKSKNKFSVSKK